MTNILARMEWKLEQLCKKKDRNLSFWVGHKTHEELYFILKGEGEYQVDGEVFPMSEDSIVRVAPAGKRALKNTGEGEMLMLCIQYKADSFGENDSPAGDGVILGDKLTW